MAAYALLLALALVSVCAGKQHLSAKKSIVYGPGLNPRIVSPARYIYIQAVDEKGKNYTASPGKDMFKCNIMTRDGRGSSYLKTKASRSKGRSTSPCYVMEFFSFISSPLCLSSFFKSPLPNIITILMMHLHHTCSNCTYTVIAVFQAPSTVCYPTIVCTENNPSRCEY